MNIHLSLKFVHRNGLSELDNISKKLRLSADNLKILSFMGEQEAMILHNPFLECNVHSKNYYVMA